MKAYSVILIGILSLHTVPANANTQKVSTDGVAYPCVPQTPPPAGEKQTDFLEFTKVYADGSPAPNVPFVVHLPDCTTREGVTDKNGFVRLENIPVGQVAIEYGEDPNPPESLMKMELHMDDMNKLLSYGKDAAAAVLEDSEKAQQQSQADVEQTDHQVDHQPKSEKQP